MQLQYQNERNNKKLNFVFQLKPIEYLLGTTAKLGEVIVLGMLTQLKEVMDFTQIILHGYTLRWKGLSKR